MYRNLIAITFLTLASVAQAQDEGPPLTGSIWLDPEICPKGVKSEGCIMSFTVDGKVAEMLYEGMTAKPARDECIGGFSKSDNSGLNCSKGDDGVVFCNFGYDFTAQKLGPGTETC